MIKLIKRYHPERHYMRGPGPKWLEKRSGGIDRIGPAADVHCGDKHFTHGLLLPAFARQALLGVALFNHEHISQIAPRVAVVRHVAAAT